MRNKHNGPKCPNPKCLRGLRDGQPECKVCCRFCHRLRGDCTYAKGPRDVRVCVELAKTFVCSRSKLKKFMWKKACSMAKGEEETEPIRFNPDGAGDYGLARMFDEV